MLTTDSILSLALKKGTITTKDITKVSGVSRQYANRLIGFLVQQGELVKRGSTKNAVYLLPSVNQPTVEEIRKKVRPILRAHGISRAGLFGSAATGKMNEQSDIDILVEIKKAISLLEFIEIKQAIEKRVGRKVDLVEYKAIKPALEKRLLQEQIVLL